jgi:steroid delta-isomerase-like uncharacterized protein
VTAAKNKRNRAIARRFFEEAVARQCERAADDLVAPHAILHGPLGRYTGPGGIKRFSRRLRSAYPDFRIAVEDVIADGGRVSARWTMHGTQRGEHFGIPPTGKPETIRGVGGLRVVDGKIAESWMAEH